MKLALATITIFALIAPMLADEFHLTDAQGKKYGPFNYEQGEKLVISGQEYTISKIITREQIIIERMKRIVISKIDFRQANLNDVLAFLQEASVEYDPKTKQMRSISSVLNLDSPTAKPTEAPDLFDADVFDPFAMPLDEYDQGTRAPLVTFEARNISLYDVINVICKIHNLEWSIQNSVVMIESKRKEKKKEKVQQTPPRDSIKAADGLTGTREE